jgi:rod shape-determining protein MreD
MMRRYNVLKWVTYAFCLLLLVVFQMQAPFYPHFTNITPLFAIPAVVAVAMVEGETAGGLYGIAAGLCWDTGTGRVFGFNALLLMILGVMVGLFVKYLIKPSALSSILFTALFSVTHLLLTWFFFCFLAGDSDILFALLHTILPTACVTLVFSVPFYLGARAVFNRLTEQNGDSPI